MDLRQSANVGSLDVRAGKIKQNDPATIGSGNAGTITVTTGLFWSGGTINSNTVAGNFNLAPGAQGTIEPTNEGDVSLGSTLTLLAAGADNLGAVLEIDSGTVNLVHGRGFVVKKGSLINFAPVPKGISPPEIKGDVVVTGQTQRGIDDDGYLNVEAEAKAVFKAKSRLSGNTNPAVVKFVGKKPLLETRGRIEITDRARLQFTVNDVDDESNLGSDFGYRQHEAAQGQNDPVSRIEAGCSIVCQQRTSVVIGGGRLELAERRGWNGQPLADQPPVFITAEKETIIALSMGMDTNLTRSNSNPKVPLTLQIEGGEYSMQCAGNIDLYAERSVYVNDQILADGRVFLTAHATVSMHWFNNAGSFPTEAPPWNLIESSYVDLMGNAAAIIDNSTFVDPPLNPPFELLVAGLSSNNKKYIVQPNS